MDKQPLAVEAVPFHEDTLLALRHPDGRVLVGLRRCCECLGLDHASQWRQLTDKSRSPWATVLSLPTVAQDGHERDLALVDIESLPMWLATVDAARLPEPNRVKLVRYQTECARTLRAHFADDRSAGPPPAASEAAIITRLANALDAARREMAEMAVRQRVLEARVSETAEHLDERIGAVGRTAREALAAAAGGDGMYCVLGWNRMRGRDITREAASRDGKALTAVCRRRGLKVGRQKHPVWGVVNTYPEALLAEYYAAADAPTRLPVGLLGDAG